MAIPHANSGQPIDVRPLGAELSKTRTVALFKTGDVEVIRMVLPAGKSMPLHKVAGDITIQCIEGKIEITAEDQSQTLQADQLMYLSGGILHSLLGLQDASALLTIVLRK